MFRTQVTLPGLLTSRFTLSILTPLLLSIATIFCSPAVKPLGSCKILTLPTDDPINSASRIPSATFTPVSALTIIRFGGDV